MCIVPPLGVRVRVRVTGRGAEYRGVPSRVGVGTRWGR